MIITRTSSCPPIRSFAALLSDLFIAAALITCTRATATAQPCVTPVDDLLLTSNTTVTLCPGTYTLTDALGDGLLRVDNGFQITERDPEAAYILFEYQHPESGTRVTPGAIELIPRANQVTVLVKLTKMPRYHEEVLASSLRRKLEAEYGEPPPRTKPKPPADPPDGGTDGAPHERSGG